ncbi:MBL fold metallo-hydrolase [Pseudonocardia sp.]|uniref:MBL fold metallo-hydrolase n=1 Tax=Pseudonocardia sp. TaxID=60912 RepID=UPI00260E9F2D|nr:MBL fold metallo-hydrolase [Pseudonocardia sp.]
MLTRIRDDLWETAPDSPFPGLTTHAYVWTPPSGRNVLFYSTAGDADHDAIEALGGIAHQYLSHRDEAGPALARLKDRFGSRLHSSAAEAGDVRRFAEPDVLFEGRHVDTNGIEVIPTPGHTPGSTCFVVPGVGGSRYLFTGDTAFVGGDGCWAAGHIPPISDVDTLAASLELLSTLDPDLVVSSAFPSERGAHPLTRGEWAGHARQAITSIRR